MNRRRYLAMAVAAGGTLVTGCIGITGDTDEVRVVTTSAGGTQEPPTQTPTETSEPTPTAASATEREPSRTLTRTRTPNSPQAREQYPDYDWAKVDSAVPTTTSRIAVSNTAFFLQEPRIEFVPTIAAVLPETALPVENDHSETHTFTAPRLDIDERLEPGERTTVTLSELGTFEYVCTEHGPSEVGRIVVTENLPTPTTAGPLGNTSGNA